MTALFDSPHLDTERCRRALESRDSRFDGWFIVGVTSTGIYCRPSCPTPVHPKPKNTRFFPTTAAAQRFGLRACKRCRPDATPGSPAWDLRGDLIGRAMKMIADGVVDREGVEGLANRLCVGPRHLRRLLTEELGAGPLALARAQRAQTARVLIETTSLAFADIAFAAGFSSIRQFNATVKEVFAVSPRELRKLGPTTKSAVTGLRLRLPYREPFDADQLFAWLAYRAIAGVAEGTTAYHRRALPLPHGYGRVELRPASRWVDATFELDDLRDLAVAVERCRRLLDLDADPAAVTDVLGADPALASTMKQHRGLRVPGTTDPTETAVFTVLGQQRSVVAAVTLASRIVERVRESASTDELKPFPTAAEIAQADLDHLGLTGRNITTTQAIASAVSDGHLVLEPGTDRVETRSRLLSINGIGPWSADYLALRALGDPDVLLHGDLVVRKSAAAAGLADLAERSTRWSPWRSYATHVLWAMQTKQEGPK